MLNKYYTFLGARVLMRADRTTVQSQGLLRSSLKICSLVSTGKCLHAEHC